MRTAALIKRIVQQMLRDKRTLALMMVAPLLILTLMYYMFNNDGASSIKLGIVDGNDMIISQLRENNIEVIPLESVANMRRTIMDQELDGVLSLVQGQHMELTLRNSDPSATKAMMMKLQQVITSVQSKLQLNMEQQDQGSAVSVLSPPKMKIDYVYGGEDTTFFEVLSPVLVGFFVFFFVFLISGISLLRERTTGTLDRLVATPIRRSEIVFGYLSGYGIFAVIQTVIVVLYAIKVLDIVLVGSIGYVILINLLLALVALSLALLLSSFANTEFQMVQFIPIVAIPQVFFAGIFPVDGMADWLQVIARIMPMYYGGDALQGVMYRGEGLGDITSNLLVLLGFAILFIGMNIFALKKYRKI